LRERASGVAKHGVDTRQAIRRDVAASTRGLERIQFLAHGCRVSELRENPARDGALAGPRQHCPPRHDRTSRISLARPDERGGERKSGDEERAVELQGVVEGANRFDILSLV
jgi:hypothetical protein